MGRNMFCRITLAWTLCAFAISLFTPRDDKAPCDIDSTNVTCPDGYCCVRNQSDFTDSFCQPQGVDGSTCPTYKSKYICPCSDKFFCQQTSNTSALGVCKSKIIDIPCDLKSRNDSCPTGMCCVRDEFLFTYTHCKALGEEGNACVTQPSFYECPCKYGFVCSSNVQGSHVSSVFGSCKAMATAPPTVTNATDGTNETTTVPDTMDNSTTTDLPDTFTGKAMVG